MSHADNWMIVSLIRSGLLLLAMLCSLPAPTLAETPAADKSVATQTPEDVLRAVETELAAARAKLASGPSRPLGRLVAEGIATQTEQDEWTFLLNLRIASLEKHLDALRNLAFEIRSLEENREKSEAWTGFTKPPPYTIDFIDDLWTGLLARQRDMEALQIARNLATSQIEGQRAALKRQQTAGRQAAEQAQQAKLHNAANQLRLDWLSELAGERTQSTVVALAQYETQLRYFDESLANQQLNVDLLKRQIEVANRASPLTQEELDHQLAGIAANLVDLERELAEAVVQEQKAQDALRAAREELQQRQADNNGVGSVDSQNRTQFAQSVVDTRKVQAETAMLRLEVLRPLLDVAHAEERVWRYRFEVAHAPTPTRLREMRDLLDEVKERMVLWQRYVNNSLDVAADLAIAAEKRQADTRRDELERTMATAMLDAYRQRKEMYARVQTELNQLQLLAMRWEHEVLAKGSAIPRGERINDLLGRLASGAVELWNLELFAVKDTITVEGREVTGSSSITVGKIVKVILILTLGLWAAAMFSVRISQLLRKRMDMNTTAATLLERGLYILSVIVLVLIALDIVNIPLTVFAFLGGALAIGIGFGAQTLINNFISGMILLIERPISLGDLVEVEGVRGRVGAIGARCSRIHRADGIDMLVPNSMFLEKNVTNLTLTDTKLRVSVKIGVAYGSPLREVTRLLEEAVASHGKVLKDPAPLILFEDFGDNALMFDVDFWVNVTSQLDYRVVASDLRYMIERLFREAGIVIAYPQRDVHLDQTRPLEIVVKSDGVEPGPATEI